MKKRSVLLLLLVLVLTVTSLPLTAANAATYYYISGTSYLKIREAPDSGALVLDSYRADFAVVSYKKYDSTWAYVHFSDGQKGYVMRKYLKSSTTSNAWVTTDDIPLRSGPAVTFQSTGTLFQGDKVRVLTRGAVWCYISGNAGTGYVKKSLLSNKAVKKSGNAAVPYTAYVQNPTGRTVNVRFGPGTNYGVDDELAPGTKVTVERINGSWSEISGPASGWMMSRYLTKTPPEPTPTLAPGETATPAPTKTTSSVRYITSPNGKSVNVRHGPSEKGYAVMFTLDVGTEVVLKHTENGWSYIYAGFASGYVKNQYLTSRKPGTTPTPKPGETPEPTKAPFKSFKAYIYNENGRSVNIRQDAGTGYATVGQLKSGTKIKVMDEKGDWYYITDNDGITGYVMKQYVSKKKNKN